MEPYQERFMPDTVTQLAAQAQGLSAPDRERLVDLLLGDLDARRDPSAEEAWRHEIRRRVARYESGTAVLHEAGDVMKEVRRLLP